MFSQCLEILTRPGGCVSRTSPLRALNTPVALVASLLYKPVFYSPGYLGYFSFWFNIKGWDQRGQCVHVLLKRNDEAEPAG